jgi:hypothetical protein
MIRALAGVIFCLAGCAAQPRPVAVVPIAMVPPAPPPVVAEAKREESKAKQFVKARPEMSTDELLRMLDLMAETDRSVRQVQAERTRANVQAAHDAIKALRSFMARGRR